MEFSIATLLANFTEDKLVAPKVLEKKLGCNDNASLRKLQIVLDALEKIGILVKERGKYRRVFEEGLVEAKLRCSSKGFCFAIQEKEGAEDIYIRECNLSTAWNGDRVLVKITKEGSRRRSPEGEVKLILERANPSVLARLKESPSGYKALPLDDRLLFEIDVLPNGIKLEEAVDSLVHVEILRYPLGSNPPLGRVVQVLGSDAEQANDLDIVCCKHDLPRNFPESVQKALKNLSKQLRKTDMKTRLDLRKLLTLAIATQSSFKTLSSKEDIGADISLEPCIEHALTLEKQRGSKWRLGIHISDVTAYVTADEAFDREARKRGNAIFLGDTTIPMLPEALSANRCSLLPGEDRLAISVLVTLNASGQILEYEIQPSVIKVDHQLSVEEAEAILERSEDSALSPLLEQMAALAETLKAQRLERGAPQLNLPKSNYGIPLCPFDDEGDLGMTVAIPANRAHAMLTECIILANQLVATHLQALAVPAIYRIQPKPDMDDVEEFIKLAANLGVNLELENPEEVRPQDYQRFTQQFAGTQQERVLTYLMQETLKPATYSTTPGPHFGLALETGYTHCTSPVQRYADLLIQRVLHAIFEYGRDRRTSRAKESVNLRHSSSHGQINWNVLPPEVQHELEEQLTTVVSHLSERERVAQEAEDDLEGLKKAGAMKERTGETFSGLITGVQSYGFFVEIEELLVEGLVHVSSLKDDWYEYRSRQQTLVGRKNRKQYRLGDRVEVQVKSVDYYRQQIDLVAVGGGSEATNGDDDDLPPLLSPSSSFSPYLEE